MTNFRLLIESKNSDMITDFPTQKCRNFRTKSGSVGGREHKLFVTVALLNLNACIQCIKNIIVHVNYFSQHIKYKIFCPAASVVQRCYAFGLGQSPYHCMIL